MMKLESKAVKQVIGRWRNILHLEPYWQIKFQIRNSSNEMSDGNQDSMACIHVDLRYFVAEIEFNATEINDGELDAVVLHELLHIILEPITCSSACGLGRKFEEMSSILCESTIERLMPGYLELYQKAYGNKKLASKKKSSNRTTRATKCNKKRHPTNN